MAESLDDSAFWLPTQILDDTDDFPTMDVSANTASKARKNGGFGFGFDADGSKALFPFDFPYGGGYGAFGAPPSDLSSPVESSETESDEEDYLAGLTRQMARSTLQDELKHSDSVFGPENPNPKGWVASGSPQSTLCAVGSGCGCGGQGSSRGSPNAQSPPATWDLLHAAAGEVAKMRVNQSMGLLGVPIKPSPVSLAPNHNHHPDVGYYLHQQSQQSLSHKHLQAAQFQRLRQQQTMKEQSSAVWGAQARYQQPHAHPMVQPRGRINTPTTLNARALGLSTGPWPTLQQAQQPQQFQKNGSGFRAVFLGSQNPGAKKECAGTGVFLPRQIGAQAETRKKPGCSTVLLPARVVQALNLNIDDICVPQQQQPQHPQLQRRFNGRYCPDYEVALRLRSNAAALSQLKRNIRQQPPVTNEIRLPQEWTY